ncbi:MAG: glutamine-synthetase adenylyltransferase [Candidatus Solibacter usitatus]|nr:glutamine-synthetase adenylyltransferase [Candidatus Solibacter usitatus]
MGQGIGEAALSRIHVLLAASPDPDQALHFLERLREQSPAAFEEISQAPAALRYLVAIFSYSTFLSEALLRYPEWAMELATAGDLDRVLTQEEFTDRLERFLWPHGAIPQALDLARFRRRQLLRIVLRDVLGLAALAEVTEELSNLADATLDFAYQRIRDALVLRHGAPQSLDGACGFSIISLGKLGGKELNYSSDIDLMFIYSANGQTDGADAISNKEFFKKVANQATELLSTYTTEGQCYRVDLRLRPDGRYGEVCISLDGARDYYRERARDWELQMLIKARVSAGEKEPGRELLEFVEPLIYSTTLDFRAVESVSETRERIAEKLAAKRSAHAGLDIKLARGGIRDIEFLVQCLQRLHGGREPWVRHGGTMFALSRLRDKDLLSAFEYTRLASAYQFLRNLEHRLQFDEDRQTHSLPTDLEALEILAQRMPRSGMAEISTADTLERELDAHLGDVEDLYERLVHAAKPAAAAAPRSQASPEVALERGRARLNRGRDRFEFFLEKLGANPPWLARLITDPDLMDCAADVFEHSPYIADQLIRYPGLIEELAMAGRAEDFSLAEEEWPAEPDALRRVFLRHMLRIQIQSVHRRMPIFTTLGYTSELADWAIAAAYKIALAQSLDASPPKNTAYAPRDQMMVIALGRLGMREFDLASDADLVFVLPDADAPEHLFWTGVAERMIQAISAYTGQGVLFTVDARLRPDGRSVTLVQTERLYRDYFATRAEAWEGIAYMKARAVAGNLAHATEFLHQLQDIDWRRYGQSGRSRPELAQMRARLEKEQGAKNPLKAGRGGYYDIDFALMYLRLKGAGIFFKVLNTPERIDVIEKMGHLERDDAEFLRDAATFYRAVDHGLRLSAGHAEGRLPTSPEQLQILTGLVYRWTPAHLHGAALDVTLAEIRDKTREFFDRQFT